MPNIKWTICIATTPRRAEKLSKLLKSLLPQVEAAEGKVEILIFFNNFEYSIGYLRQQLIEEAKGEYVTHVDDDDEVPSDYVATILPLLDGVDYVGFRVRFIDEGQLMKPVYHSLKYSHWYQDNDGYYRDVTHLNPIKRSLALEAGFPIESNIGEDEAWASKVKPKTEHYIDREMYIYHHFGDESVAYKYTTDEIAAKVHHQNYKPKPDDTPKRPKIDSPYVRLHPRSTPDAN